MTDNKAIKSDASATILTAGTKEVTFSGDLADIQLVELVAVGGTEGARTITEISSETDGILVNLGPNNDVSGTVTANLGTIADVATQTTLSALNGKVTAVDTGAVVIASGTTVVTQPTAANLKAEVVGTGTFSVQVTTAPTTAVTGTFWQTTQPVSGNLTTVSTVSTVTAVTAITNALPVGSNLIGDVGLQPRTTGGLLMDKTTSAASTNATSLKASAGQVYSAQVFNVNAAVRYFKLYNKASAPTVGTDTPVKTLAIPGNTAGGGFVISWPQGLAFGTGIAWALTTEATDAGTTGVAADEITVNLDYT